MFGRCAAMARCAPYQFGAELRHVLHEVAQGCVVRQFAGDVSFRLVEGSGRGLVLSHVYFYILMFMLLCLCCFVTVSLWTHKHMRWVAAFRDGAQHCTCCLNAGRICGWRLLWLHSVFCVLWSVQHAWLLVLGSIELTLVAQRPKQSVTHE